MRHIHKHPPPQALLDWLALANDDWQPTYDDLRGEEKRATLASLLREQGYLCGYCEQSIDVRANDCHIEHLRPQETFPELALDHTNLMASCQGEPPPEPTHCGHAKSNWYDPLRFISPTQADCHSAFAFTLDGHIRPAANVSPDRSEAAATTITRLNLNARNLVAARAAALEGLMLGLDMADPVGQDKILERMADLSLPDTRGRLHPFVTFLLDQLARLCAAQAPSPPSPRPRQTPRLPLTSPPRSGTIPPRRPGPTMGRTSATNPHSSRYSWLTR